ncbi:MAG: YhjD/YihY/BrkB family envelope integrity protein [Actinomycetota bacterium]
MSLAREVLVRFRQDEVDTHAAALAYQLFLSTLALSLVALAIIGLVEDALPFDLPGGTEEQARNLAGGDVALGIASFFAVLWTASALSHRASRALSIVFRTGAERAVSGRLRALASTLGLVVLVGALPVLTGVLAAVRLATGLELPFRVFGLAATAALEFGLFLLAYTALTPGRIGWRTHIPGAIVMSAGWELAKLAGGLLLGYFVTKATLLYGAIGAVVGLLVVLRWAAWLFLFGAELSAILAERRDSSEAPVRT